MNTGKLNEVWFVYVDFFSSKLFIFFCVMEVLKFEGVHCEHCCMHIKLFSLKWFVFSCKSNLHSKKCPRHSDYPLDSSTVTHHTRCCARNKKYVRQKTCRVIEIFFRHVIKSYRTGKKIQYIGFFSWKRLIKLIFITVRSLHLDNRI